MSHLFFVSHNWLTRMAFEFFLSVGRTKFECKFWITDHILYLTTNLIAIGGSVWFYGSLYPAWLCAKLIMHLRRTFKRNSNRFSIMLRHCGVMPAMLKFLGLLPIHCFRTSRSDASLKELYSQGPIFEAVAFNWIRNFALPFFRCIALPCLIFKRLMSRQLERPIDTLLTKFVSPSLTLTSS